MNKPIFILQDKNSYNDCLSYYYEKVWYNLSSNLNAIHILEQNLDKINWCNLSSNPNAIHIIERNLDKIDWDDLSKNPNAIHLFATLDYEKMKKNNCHFAEELVKYVFHPMRLINLSNTFQLSLNEYLDLI